MVKPRKRLIVQLIAATLAIGASFAVTDIAGRAANAAYTEAVGASEIRRPAPEALMPPIAPMIGAYRM